MLQEFTGVRQEKRPGRRRWFEADGLALVVWFDAANEIEGYQICYDFGSGGHALTWRPRAGFAHNGVDDGEGQPLRNATPILVPDGEVPWAELTERFAKHVGSLEPQLRDLIERTLAERR
jgi:hypothetical protein